MFCLFTANTQSCLMFCLFTANVLFVYCEHTELSDVLFGYCECSVCLLQTHRAVSCSADKVSFQLPRVDVQDEYSLFNFKISKHFSQTILKNIFLAEKYCVLHF